MSVRFAPAAQRDLEEIAEYIGGENPAAALRFVAELRHRCRLLGEMPRSGAPRTDLWPGLRSLPFGAYVIFYTSKGSNVRIERILHGARDIPSVLGDDNHG
jgi:toxin ParE1/3/4